MSGLALASRVTPFLWFDGNAEEAVEFYMGVFPNSRRIGEFRSPVNGSVPQGAVLTIAFELDGVGFTALNGGPEYKFSPAVSFVVRCDSQQEIDDYWSRLTAGGGREIQCGWLQDKFGVSWQIVPARLPELLPNPKAFQAMLTMKKLDLAELERAAGA